MGKFITARFKSACAETGQTINKGDRIYFDGNAYGKNSNVYKNNDKIDEAFYVVQAQENAYFDNFCYRNNI